MLFSVILDCIYSKKQSGDKQVVALGSGNSTFGLGCPTPLSTVVEWSLDRRVRS